MATSIRILSTKAGMVMRVGIAARLVTRAMPIATIAVINKKVRAGKKGSHYGDKGKQAAVHGQHCADP